jgi:hypothetical protein
MSRECIESRQREQKIVPAGERVRYTQEFAELGAQIAASRLGLKICARFRAKSSHAAQLARKSGKSLTNCPKTSASCYTQLLLCVNLHATFVGPQGVVSGPPEPTAASI